MRLIVFGLTLSSSWGNGHATLWRGLGRALARRGHELTFFERDVPYYAENRDLKDWADGQLVLYPDWQGIEDRAIAAIKAADAVMITSFCPDAVAATELLAGLPACVKIFYDLDTPVTLAEFRKNGFVSYLPKDGLGSFDLVLSFTGGLALKQLTELLGARKTAALYGHADPDIHRAVQSNETYRASLSYLGTFAADRQPALQRLFVQPAGLMPERRFVIGGALYPTDFPWAPNIFFVRHLPPSEHPAFFSSSEVTLNVTRPLMAEMGFCPSGRLFEAAACGTAIVSDYWPGIEEFFEPGKEIALAGQPQDVINAISLGAEGVREFGLAAQRRVLAHHTSEHRAKEFEEIINQM
jgi:spore maturation protein CgeB